MKTLPRLLIPFFKNASLKLILNLSLSILFCIPIFAQDPLPPDWKVKTKQKYESLISPEIKYDDFEQVEKSEYYRLQSIQKGVTSSYSPTLSKSICGNGDFESTSITPDPLEWTGGWGKCNGLGALIYPLTNGFLPGPYDQEFSCHTIVSGSGMDPVTNIIPLVHSGLKALRLGNVYYNYGAEVISKTFVVTPANSIINFWYALVQVDPLTPNSHMPYQDKRPKFIVVVKEGTNPVNNVVDLGNGTNIIYANASDPFFKTMNPPSKQSGKTVFRNWSCAQINLSQKIGKTITVEFQNYDCAQGGHGGYVYLDDFCGNCTGDQQGWIDYNPNSTDCKAGKICFNYGLPSNGPVNGTCQITLEILQNGIVVTTLTSPVLSTGNSYCFSFDCKNPLLNQGLGGFDFVATAIFKFGANTSTKIKGTKPDGQIEGKNNDCSCDSPIVYDPCCPPVNALILEKLFNYVAQSSGVTSPYKLTFNNDLNYRTSMQAYCNYIESIYPSLNSLQQNWRIFSCGTGTNPVGATLLETVFNSFLPMGTGTINGNINFFNSILQVNTWYKVHVGIYTDPELGFVKKECSDKTFFYFRIQVISSQRKLSISDGVKIIERKLD